MSALPELHSSIDAVINTMPDTFNTHEFILAFAQANQHIYIQALNQHINALRPFAELHGKIGTMLKNDFSERLSAQGKKTDSHDIFGNKGEAVIWKKI